MSSGLLAHRGSGGAMARNPQGLEFKSSVPRGKRCSSHGSPGQVLVYCPPLYSSLQTRVCVHTHTSPPPAYLKYQQIFVHKFRYQGYKFGFPPDTCLAAPCASLQTPAPHLFLLAPTERKLHSSLLVTLTCLSSHTWLSTTCPTQKGRAPLGLFPVGCKD